MKKTIKKILRFFFNKTRWGKIIDETKYNQTPITLKILFYQKILGINRNAYWPMNPSSTVVGWKNILAGIDSSPGYSPGCYIQGGGKLYIGDYTQIGPNVGLISSNHDIYDSQKKVAGTTKIGKYCWIGMNAVVLPGVELGDFTIVGAGTIVSKSFPEGYCIIVGNPCKKLKDLDKSKCNEYEYEYKYNGFIKSTEFEEFRKINLNV